MTKKKRIINLEQDVLSLETKFQNLLDIMVSIKYTIKDDGSKPKYSPTENCLTKEIIIEEKTITGIKEEKYKVNVSQTEMLKSEVFDYNVVLKIVKGHLYDEFYK